MYGALSIFIGLAAAGIHLLVSKKESTKGRVVSIILVYALVFQVGFIGFFFGFVPHVFFADRTAESIWWAAGSPFQFEVGIHDGAWGLLGFLCIWFKSGFRIAAGLGWSLFMLGAAGGHVYHTIVNADFAENNFFMIFVDGFVAFELPLLLYLDHKWNKVNRIEDIPTP